MNKLISILSLSCISIQLFSQNLTQYIHPMIGTGGHGHTFPGPTLPFAMVQLSPDTRVDGSWDGCSGYHHSDTIIYGFSHTHLSGTGCSDYGDIAFMPFFGKDVKKLNDEQLLKKGVSYSHKNEIAKAGYYSVLLDNKVKVELTTTLRAGIQKYTFGDSGMAKIILNLKHRDELLEGKINEIDLLNYSGKRVSKAWAERQELYFNFHLSKLPLKNDIIKGIHGDEYLVFEFEVKKDEVVMIKTGISGTDDSGAIRNLEAEMPNYDFERFRINANAKWNAEMAKIITHGGSDKEKINFYTALYHCMIHPSIFNDIDNRYRGRDGKIYDTKGEFDYYTVFSLWDTYRALHPLLTVLDKKRTNDFVETFLRQYEQVGKLPIWELWSNETNCMIGYHAVSVMWDAYVKKIKDYSITTMYKSMKSIAKDTTNPALKSYMKYGYVRADDDAESVSKTLEYSYNDWCIAQMAREVGDNKGYLEFSNRSRYWQNVFDSETGFMRPRLNSTQMTPFSPYMVDNNFTEANSFQYSFYMPHDLEHFKSMIGGEANFDKKLDELFAAKSKTEGREQADITGLIGQYAHGNEPSHHIAWLYSDRAKRTKLIKQIRDNFYNNTPDGLIGNEDCGQMSAWYVWAALGMYPICPGDKHMTTCDGMFDSVKVKSDVWTISVYKHDSFEFFNLRDQHNDVDPSELELQKQPYIRPCQKIFKNQQWIKLAGGEKIMYSIDNTPSKVFKDSILIDKTCILNFYSEFNDKKSFTQTAKFYKLPNDRTVLLNCKYNPQYHAGGPMGLIDGIHGDENWRKGDWLGFQGQDFETIISLDKEKMVKEINTSFLQDQKAWIFFPTMYTISISTNGIDFKTVYSFGIDVPRADDKNYIKKLSHNLNANAKYIKITAKNYGKIPSWHPGAGGDAFIFVDEVEVK